MLTLESLEVGQLYRCKTRRGLLQITRYQQDAVWTTSHITEVHPETPFVYLEVDKATKIHLKVLTIDGIVGHIRIYNTSSEFDMEKVQ